MNKKLFFLSSLFCFALLFQAKAQSVVNVNPLTGAGNVFIPVYTVSSGNVSVPISLSYSGNGIKPKDVEGTAGMGWQLNAGGQVSRVVRGLPDDCTKDNSGATMLGWMSTSNTGATYAKTFTPQNNGSTCSTGNADVTAINANMPYTYDTEPDVFYVNAPGLSLQMVFNRDDQKFHPVGYQDLIINYSVQGGTGNNTGNITSFTVTNDKGLTYVFAAPESVTQTTQAYNNVAPNYLTTKYKQYKQGITFADSWSLVSITDLNANAVTFYYTTGLVRNSTDPIALYLGGATSQTLEYKVLQAVTPQLLGSISTVNVNSSKIVLGFTWNTPILSTQTGQTYIASIVGMGRNYQFNYNNVYFNSGSYSRAFLTGFADAGCTTPINYQFGYNNPSLLGDSTSTANDFWGYYNYNSGTPSLLPPVYVNPSTSGLPRYEINAGSAGSAYAYSLTTGAAVRAVFASTISYGSLSTITYAQGGTTSIIYEPNDFLDVPSNTVTQGGGIRVKQIVDDPGNGGAQITRNYSYTNSSGVSTGAPVTLPQYAFQIPYSGTVNSQATWASATALSAYDLSMEDHTIMYSSVKVSQTGAGSTVYNYNVPATQWSTSATPVCSGCTTAEWSPSISYAGNYNCSNNIGPVANLPYGFPFAPNLNYDFERGLPASVINYNDAGTEVSESDYTYQRVSPPLSISAFKHDDVTGSSTAKFYTPYKLFYNTGELTATVTKKVFDLNSTTSFQTTTTTNSYTSPNHKLLSSQSVTNSDNSTVTTYYSYIKDYAPNNTGGNANINALYALKLNNVNAPVEVYQQVARGSNISTTSAALTLFSRYVSGGYANYLPSQQLKLVQPDGASFTPFSINNSAQTIAYDPNYTVVANYDAYDNRAVPVTVDDNNRHIQTTYVDAQKNRAVAAFQNANYTEVAFNDFDSQIPAPLNSFTVSGTTTAVTGVHTGSGTSVAAGSQTVTSGTITKNTAAKYYVFSVWISGASAAGTLSFSGGTAAIPSLAYAMGGPAYYEMKIPASSLGATFALSFTSSQGISIDDVILYPDVSEVSTVSYDPTSYFKVAETNTNGISAYYTNDNWGRLLYAFDQDRNIVERKQYISWADIQYTPSPSLSVPNNVYNGIAFTISNTTPATCFSQYDSYSWDFGDGHTFNNAPPGGVSYTYGAIGTYTVKLVVTNSFLGTTRSASVNVNVVALPNVNITYHNTCQTGGKVVSQINTITFSQGGVTKYMFYGSDLQAGVSIVPGVYNITINASGTLYNMSTNPTGYGSIDFAGSTDYCMSYSSSNYQFTSDLTYTPNVLITIQPSSCSTPIQ